MYEVKCFSNRPDFILYKDNEPELKVHFQRGFRAESNFNGIDIQFKPQNAWGRKFDIIHDGKDVGDVIFKWKGQAIILYVKDNKTHSFLVKPKRMLRSFEVYNQNEKLLFTIKKSSGLFQRLSYTVVLELEDLRDIDLRELMLYCCYTTMIIRKKASNHA